MSDPTCTLCNGKGSPSGAYCLACWPKKKKGGSTKRYLIVAASGVLFGSNISVEGATGTALRMVGDEMIAIVDSKTMLVEARVGVST